MNARNLYISLIRYSRPPESNFTGRHLDIRRELTEWILLRHYTSFVDDLDDLALKIDISREDISHYIVTAMGVRYATLRKRLRISDALVLLSSGLNESLSGIGRIVGYADKRNFRKAFAEETGHYPCECRIMDGGGAAASLTRI